jgi:hypothetical protein
MENSATVAALIPEGSMTLTAPRAGVALLPKEPLRLRRRQGRGDTTPRARVLQGW